MNRKIKWGVHVAKPNAVKNRCLQNLFEVELRFKQGMARVESLKKIEGEYVGSGVGIVKGPGIKGTVRWDLFEEREETLCRSSLFGVIDTDDGAQIQFDSRGFFVKPDESNPNKWITSASVHFNTVNERYDSLNTCLAVWEGEFDVRKLRHHYYAYVPCKK